MRINVYAEEMTDRVEIVGKEIDGRTYTGLRFYLELPVTLPNGENYAGPFYHRPGDDDSAAVTFWGKQDLRALLRHALAMLDAHYAEPAAEHERRHGVGELAPLTREQTERFRAALADDGQGVQCCECDQEAVGYSEDSPYCAAHYRSRPSLSPQPPES